MAITHAQIGEWAAEFDELNKTIKAQEARLEELKTQLKDVVPVGTEIIAGNFKIIHQVTQVTALNQGLLKKEYPDVAAKCMETKERESLRVH